VYAGDETLYPSEGRNPNATPFEVTPPEGRPSTGASFVSHETSLGRGNYLVFQRSEGLSMLTLLR
jgi:hypothetical protein